MAIITSITTIITIITTITTGNYEAVISTLFFSSSY